MSRPLVPRPQQTASSPVSSPGSAFRSGGNGSGGGGNTPSSFSSQRPRKISTACGACKQRKTRCTGGTPCEACASRDSQCIYDITSDQRRKIANQRNVQDLAEAQLNLERHRQLLGGIVATLRAGGYRESDDLISIIRSGVDLSQIAAHVRNAYRSSPPIQEAFNAIEFVIDGDDDLPHANVLFTGGASHETSRSRRSISNSSGEAQIIQNDGFQRPTNMLDGEMN